MPCIARSLLYSPLTTIFTSMFLRFDDIPDKKLVGMRLSMTLHEGTTTTLWKSFMQKRSTIKNAVGTNLISMQVYNPAFDVQKFTPHTRFDKWATTEVTDHDNVPDGMEPFTLPCGQYAVFLHKGGPAKAREIFGYIFSNWLPSSGCELEHRPHFEILGERYSNTSAESEEEIWIPVKQREK